MGVKLESSLSSEKMAVQTGKDGAVLQRSLSKLVSFRSLSSKEVRSRALLPLLVVAGAQTGSFLWRKFPLKVSVPQWEEALPHFDLANVIVGLLALLVCVVLQYYWFQRRPTYLLDFCCFKADDSQKITKEKYAYLVRKSGFFVEKSMTFQDKILASSGIGDETYVAPSTTSVPPDRSFTAARLEAETVMFGVLDGLFSTGMVRPEDIGILVVNCSVFCPTPSLSAIIVNRYKLREDIEAYSLGGMGCSAGVIAINLCRDLLKVRKNTYAVAVSLEVISGLQGYTGNNRSMMVSNCIFRWGGSAVLLSNKRGDRKRAKYELLHVVRTHRGADDKSFKCVNQEEDEDGIVGVSLSKDLMPAAAVALKINITKLAPLILPISEQVKFAANFVARKFLNLKYKSYTPDFKKAFNHFCIHPGGKAVLDGIEENLQLTKWHMEPSRMTLHRFGNTSSSALWYVLAYMEAKGRVRRGDRVWQIALGSGLKCNSAIWKSLSRSQKGPSSNPWSDFIDKYPMPVYATNLKM